MLHEHQVGLLARFGAEAVAEALGEGDALGRVVLREGRIGDDPVEAHQLAALDVQRLGQGVAVAQVRVRDAVQDHVHLADGPDPAVVLLPVEAEVARVAAVLAHMLGGEDQHAARARAGVVDPHALLGVGQADHHAHHGPRGVELAALLARRVGELADQVLVGGPEQVGELEVLVAQPVPVEVLDQLAQLLVRQLGLADGAGEVDVVEHALQAGVLLLQRPQGLVEPVADVVVQLVAQVLPAGPLGDEEGVLVVALGVSPAAPPLGACGPLASCSAMISWRRASNTSEQRFRNSIPKMYSLNSEASILPRRTSAAPNRWRSSCARVSGMSALRLLSARTVAEETSRGRWAAMPLSP